jgi:2-polyprenyl-3-methyl-5-hydroxy-6-metoxy-1,4-benzoquinol methylase
MSQRITGLYRLTQIPFIYSTFQNMLGADRFRRELVSSYIRPQPGERVLDFGCGPGTIFPYLGDVASYTGIDLNGDHIETAKAQYGDKATFHCGSLETLEQEVSGPFDLAVCVGVLHHLDDSDVDSLCRIIFDKLAPQGRLVTLDTAFVDGQHWIARWLASRDSGQSVRAPEGYSQRIRQFFPSVEVSVRHDLLRLPYTHCMNVARKV